MSAPGRAVSKGLWIAGAIIALILLVAIGGLASWLWSRSNQPHVIPPVPAPLAMFERPIPDGPDAAQLRRGRYLVMTGDCASCHTRAGGRILNGGRGLNTPFGVIYSPDITGDTATGLGNWNNDQFFRALNKGISRDGDHLYPAFPFPHFTLVRRSDADAMLAYLKTVPGNGYTPPPNALPFPLNLRISAAAWQALFFHDRSFQPDRSKSQAWNRGAYLVEGLGHCSACHTPTDMLGAEEKAKYLQGGKLDNWVAPDLTSNPRTGLGRWSAAEIAEFLKTGRNVHSDAAGSMAEVVSYSTSEMSDEDRFAIATYLKSIPASPSEQVAAPDAKAMAAGRAVYSDACAACHHAQGGGSPGLFAPLAGSNVVQQRDPASVIHLILAGGRAAPTPTRPTAVSMPSFAWKLTDQEAADVATYIRNSWGNHAPSVSANDVAGLRKALQLPKSFQPENFMTASD